MAYFVSLPENLFYLAASPDHAIFKLFAVAVAVAVSVFVSVIVSACRLLLDEMRFEFKRTDRWLGGVMR